MDKIDLDFLEKIEDIKIEFNEILEQLNSIEVMTDNKLFLFNQRKLKHLKPLISKADELDNIKKDISETNELLLLESDEIIKNQLINEIKNLNEKQGEILKQMKSIYFDIYNSSKENCLIELKLKSGDMENLDYVFQIFQNFVQINNLEMSIKEKKSEEITFIISGDNCFKNLSIFSGNCKIINREKESIVSIVVLSNNVKEIIINQDDIVIETFKSGGAGGQHINKTESAIRLIHKPTGIVSVCQDERSQLKNKERAFENLKLKLQEKFEKDSKNDLDFQRKKIKNALFSLTPILILDFDKNCASYFNLKKNYKLKQILDGELKIVSNDVVLNV